MKLFREFEKKLESLFEGVFLRAFRSGVQPVELGKKLVRELEGNKTIWVERVYVPNRYEVGLSPRDFSRFESFQAVLATELENLLVQYVSEKRYTVIDQPRIKFTEDYKLREGDFWIRCNMEGELPSQREREQAPWGEKPVPPPRGRPVLELLGAGENSQVFPLTKIEIRIGRLPTNDIVLPDPNVSRVHARVQRQGETFIITDLESTNGTWINEQRTSECELTPEDMIRLGSTRLIFRRI